jgi:hypothetical protein
MGPLISTPQILFPHGLKGILGFIENLNMIFPMNTYLNVKVKHSLMLTILLLLLEFLFPFPFLSSFFQALSSSNFVISWVDLHFVIQFAIWIKQ